MVSGNAVTEAERLVRNALAAMVASLKAQDAGDWDRAELARDQAMLYLRRAAVSARELIAEKRAQEARRN